MSKELKRVLHPGYHIREYIDALEITQDEFAKRLGISGKQLSLLLSYKASITPDIAHKLSKMMGINMEFWLRLQSKYDTYEATKKELEGMEKEKEIYKQIDKKFLRMLGIIEEKEKPEDGIKKLRTAAMVSNLSLLETPDLYTFCRTAVNKEEETKNIICRNLWITLAYKEAQQMNVSSFNEKNIINNIDVLRSYTLEDPNEFYPKMKKILNDSGVAFVLLPSLANSNINGAIKWIDDKRVMMALNTRGATNDKFWFSFFHELKHVLQKVKRKVIIGDTSKVSNIDEYEVEADLFARDTLIPKKYYSNFHDYTKRGIINFANEIGIHPGIVVGRLQKEGKIGFNNMNDLKEKYKITV